MEAPQQGVELLFPIGTGKQAKGAKISKKEKNATSLLKKLKAIEKGGDINAVDKFGQTALMHAAAQNNRLAVCWLIAKGADVTKKSKKGKTARDFSTTIAVRELLRLAATEKEPLTEEQDDEYVLVTDRSPAGLRAELEGAIPYVSDVAVLLKLGKVNLNTPNAEGALLLSHKSISVESAAYCIRHGADVYKRNGKGEPLLVGKREPVWEETANEVELLLLSLGLKSDETKTAELPAAFLSAVYSNDCDKVKKLTAKHPHLAKEVLPDIVLRARTAEMARVLIDAGADFKKLGPYYTLDMLYIAVHRNIPAPIIKVLIDAGAPFDGDLITDACDAATVEVLIAAGQSPNAEFRGQSALEKSLVHRRWGAAEYLIAHGAELPEHDIIKCLCERVGYTWHDRPQTQKSYQHNRKRADWRQHQDRFLQMPHMLEVLIGAGIKITDSVWSKDGLGAGLFDFLEESDENLGFLEESVEDLPAEAHFKAAEETLRILLKNSTPPSKFLSHMRVSRSAPDAGMLEVLKLLIDSGADVKDALESDIALSPAVAEFLLKQGANPNLLCWKRLGDSNDPARLYAILSKYKACPNIIDVNARSGSDWTPLHDACLIGHAKTVECLIQAKADVNARRGNGSTPLHYACRQGHAKSVECLIQAQADVNAQDNNGATPLHYACGENLKPSIIKRLIRAKANVNARDKKGRTPLEICALVSEVGGIAAAKLLLHAGADVNVRNEHGQTLLHTVSNKEFLQTLIDAGADVNIQDAEGNTAAMEIIKSASFHRDDYLEILLNAGAKTNIKNRQGKTLLQMMTRITEKTVEILKDHGVKVDGQIELVKALSHSGASVDSIQRIIDSGVDVNARDIDGGTPLHLACGNGQDPSIIECLIRAKADVNAGDEIGWTPLHLARDAATTELLLKHGADPNARDKEGKTPLHSTGDAAKAELLLKHGADPNARDEEGRTPLHRAYNATMTKLLLKHGADPNAQSTNGVTPIMSAWDALCSYPNRDDYLEAFEALLDAGAKTDIKNQKGETLLQIVNSYTGTMLLPDKEKTFKILEAHGVKVEK